MEELLEKLRWATRAASKRRWLALGIAAVVAVVCGAGIATVPDRYEASATVYVDTQTVLKPLMAGLTFQPDIDQQVRMLARTLISRPNVERLVRIPELQLDVSSYAGREEVVTLLMKQIKVSPTTSGNLYEISFRGVDPGRAQRLVQATVDLFVNSGAVAKKRDSEDAGHFIEEQIRVYEGKLVEAEGRLKEFKVRNFGLSGVSNQDYFARVSTLTEEGNKMRAELNAAEQSRDAYRRELATEDPQLPGGNGNPVVQDLETRLATQKQQLDDLLRRFTEQHPDVVSARRIIAQLEADLRAAKADRSPVKGASTGKAATSPVYQKLRISFAEAEAQVASLRSQLTNHQTQLEQVRAQAARLPQVEAELTQLNRDYDVIRKNYDQMVARRESALLGVKLDESSQLAEFRVVEPPRVSSSPVFPARLHLALLAIVFSLAAGVAVTTLLDLLRPTLDDMATLRRLSGRTVLGTVSMLVTPEALRQRHTSRMRFLAMLSILVGLQVVWVAWLAFKPNIG